MCVYNQTYAPDPTELFVCNGHSPRRPVKPFELSSTPLNAYASDANAAFTLYRTVVCDSRIDRVTLGNAKRNVYGPACGSCSDIFDFDDLVVEDD